MECERPDASKSGVRQGDILAAHPGTSNWSDRWSRFFVVLSADCDCANQKGDSGLVVVPVIGLATYIDEAWLPVQVEKTSADALVKIERGLNRFGGKRIQSSEVRRIAAPNLLEQLRHRAGEDRELLDEASKVAELHQALLVLDEIAASLPPVPNVSFGELHKRYFEAKSVVTGRAAEPEKDTHAALASLGDPKRTDMWPICDLIGLDGQMREDESLGFVAYLRRFRTIPYGRALISKGDWLGARDSYLRICRLRGIYKADLVQRFASLFSRVGLEDERDSEHARVFKHAAEKIVQRIGQ